MRTYSAYQTDISRIINNSDTDSVAWATEMINDSTRRLVNKFYFNERSYTTSTLASQQFYNLPPQVLNLINVTVNIGSVLWPLKICDSRQYWDSLNVIVFYQDFPTFFFPYNGQVGIFPTPASSGNTIQMNYKTRIIDLVQADVTDITSSQTMTVTNNSTTLTASGAVFLNWMIGQWIRIPFTSINATSGDNQWYQIASITSSTVAVLMNPYTGTNVTGAKFTIGQTSILPEDYQDLPLYWMAVLYYTTRFPDPVKSQLYQKMYDDGYFKLNEEFGSKSTNVAITDTDAPVFNPNLFVRSLTQN